MMTKTSSKTVKLALQFATLPLIAISIYLFSHKTIAQENSTTTQKKPSDLVFSKREVPYTIDGIKQIELDDFHNSLVKNVRTFKLRNGTETDALDLKPGPEWNRLEKVYERMSKAQQDDQDFRFYPPIGPIKKEMLTKQQYEAFKSGTKYGVWFNGKRIKNEELNKYKYENLVHLFTSKLEKNAMNYGKHYYQVEIMTEDKYQKYYNESMADNTRFLMWNREKPISERKYKRL